MRRSTTAALSERGYNFRTRQICPVTAALMGVEQENVARLERRADFLLSTLSSYVAAMGGKLRLVAEFPNRRPAARRHRSGRYRRQCAARAETARP
jgi:hypothetical protein